MLGSVARSKPEKNLCGLHVCFWLCAAPVADFLLLRKGKKIYSHGLIIMEMIEQSKLYLTLISLLTGFKSFAQKTKKYVQKVRGIKEKGMY